MPPIRIANVHDGDPGWNWIEPLYQGSPDLAWHSISTRRSRLLAKLPGPHWGRVRAGLALRILVSAGDIDLIVSHGPYTSFYAEAVGRGRASKVRHVAFAFNFTDIPTGSRLRAMSRAFSRVDKFFVYSTMERDLYADVFGIEPDRFTFVRWGVAPPITEARPKETEGPYVAALGGEARDYATLCEAARQLSDIQFVLIVRPHTLNRLDVPPNVEVHTNLDWERAWSIVWHSQAAVLPLRSRRTPNGHVTAVGAMHLGKAQVITDSIGIRDYVVDEETALLVRAGDAAGLATSVRRLMDDCALRNRLGCRAREFASEHCTETVTVECFRQVVTEVMRPS